MTRSRQGKKAMQKIVIVGISMLDSHWPEVVVKPKGKFHRAYAREVLRYDRNVSYHEYSIGRVTGIIDIKIYKKNSRRVYHNPVGAAEANVFVRDKEIVHFHPMRYAVGNVDFAAGQIAQIRFIPPEQREYYDTIGVRLHEGYYFPEEIAAEIIVRTYNPPNTTITGRI